MQCLRTDQSQWHTRLGASLLENRQCGSFQNVVLLYKIRQCKKAQKKIVSINFSCALLSVLDFSTFEDGADRLCRNIGKELPFYAV